MSVNTDNNIFKSVKKTLTIPEIINKLALKYHINFSSTLQSAIINKLLSFDITEDERSFLSEQQKKIESK